MSKFQSRVFPGMLIACGMAFASGALQAQDLANGWGPNALEITRTPQYCQDFFLKKQLPPNCDGVHHLCAGRVLIGRLSNTSIPKQERKRILSNAKNEVNYIFSRQNPQCKFMDEARATQSELRIHEMLLK